MHEIVAATAACGVSPIVRVVEGQHWMIKRALDSGAHGILVPVLETVQDAKNVVQASRFPPMATRGFEPLLAAEKFVERLPGGGVRELTGKQYLEQADSSLAIANVEEIASVPGIDVLFVGPFDLGVSIGHPIIGGVMSETLIQAIQSVQKAAQDAAIVAGIYCDSGEDAKEWASKGFLMNSVMTDMIGLRQVVSQSFKSAE
ncbi:hypothetical protein N7528_004652 [Penicillium herquei]|nr:hypothetical protein N7528_004652 [Penicillium herquei]